MNTPPGADHGADGHHAPRSVTVVGAGLAGHSVAKAMRAQGFDGRLQMVGAEQHRPYDRTPLSKEFLLGILGADDLGLERAGEDLHADWHLGRAATGLVTGERHTIELADGERLLSDAVVLATGSRVRRLPTNLAGVHTVRTLGDAQALKDELKPGARLVVVGAGFIGAEIAGGAQSLGLEVTVLEASEAPLSMALGARAGALVGSLHGRNGVSLRSQSTVAGLIGTDRVTGVELDGGEVLAADVVVVGIGAVADTDWLAESGLELESGGVLCDHTGATAVPGVFAVGDCAAWFDPVLDRHHRVEHWTDAKDRGPVVASALLGLPLPATIRAPYFWSDQYGVKIQFAGRRSREDEFRVESGSVDESSMLATYRRDGELTAVLALGRQPEFMRLRKSLVVPMPPAADRPADHDVSTACGAEQRIP